VERALLGSLLHLKQKVCRNLPRRPLAVLGEGQEPEGAGYEA
jgi:hypothetical protein